MRGVRRVHILPGRHQPPHDDHFALIRHALSRIEGALYLGLIVDVPGVESRTPFERAGKIMNAPDRAPYSFDVRREMVEAGVAECLLAEESARVQVVPLVRPEIAWDLVEAIFPERRVWIVPDVGETFDDHKAAFFASRGDEVLRITAPTTTCGWTVRNLIAARDAGVARHVPSSVVSILEGLHGPHHPAKEQEA